MNENGKVVAIEEHAVWVETNRLSTCGSCSARKGCGTTLLNSLHPGREHYLRVVVAASFAADLRPGDEVEISIPDEVVLQASAVVYLVPLALMLATALLGNNLLPGDAGTALGGLLGLLAGAGLVRLHADVNRDNGRMQPSLVRRLGIAGIELQSVAHIQ
jgi:sigma-E factor negative regulatory protein RseC